MDTFGFHSKMKLDGREFHVHTGSVTEKNIILSEIFEKGKFINSKHRDFFTRHENKSAAEQYMKIVAENLHKEMLDEIDTLFFVHAKIKVINQYIPHFRLGGVFYEKSFYNEAIFHLEKVIELKKDFVPAYHRLGLCHIQMGDLKKAREIFEKGLEIQPEFVDLLNAMGVTNCLTHNYSQAAVFLQKAIKINPDFDEANFNLGVVLFRSMLEDADKNEKIIVPSRVTRYIKSLKILDRYSSPDWQESFDEILELINTSEIENVLYGLENLQIKIVTDQEINILLDVFYLKFMYGGRELTRDELDLYERKFREQQEERGEFADYWNDLGIIHMIQCRNLFLSALDEFEKASTYNEEYEEAKRNLGLCKNNKKGFLILLRAILK